MASISEILEEKHKKKLNYNKSGKSDPRKRFDKLKELCLINNIPMKMKKYFIESIKVGLYRSSSGIKDGKYVESEFVWAKPIIHHGKLCLSLPKPYKMTVDASVVDVFKNIHVLH